MNEEKAALFIFFRTICRTSYNSLATSASATPTAPSVPSTSAILPDPFEFHSSQSQAVVVPAAVTEAYITSTSKTAEPSCVSGKTLSAKKSARTSHSPPARRRSTRSRQKRTLSSDIHVRTLYTTLDIFGQTIFRA